MKKNECNVVRDLMPLVLDRVASEESREIVETHIASCEECRKQYDAMKADLPEETRAEYEEEQKQFTDALKAVKKKKLRRRIRLIALAALACMAAVLIGLFAYDALFWKMTVPVDNQYYSLSLCKTTSGLYVITADASQLDFDTMTVSEDAFVDGRDIMYVRFMTTPIHTPASAGSGIKKSDVMTMESSLEYPADEIRQGTPGNYITIWKKGDPVPAASEEMERYYALEKAYKQWFSALPQNEDGMVVLEDEFFAWQDRLDEARNAVPEWSQN